MCLDRHSNATYWLPMTLGTIYISFNALTLITFLPYSVATQFQLAANSYGWSLLIKLLEKEIALAKAGLSKGGII